MKKRLNKIGIARIILAITGLIMILIGIYIGEPSIIIRKATRICMECIGLG